jgi:hypothetical protein
VSATRRRTPLLKQLLVLAIIEDQQARQRVAPRSPHQRNLLRLSQLIEIIPQRESTRPTATRDLTPQQVFGPAAVEPKHPAGKELAVAMGKLRGQLRFAQPPSPVSAVVTSPALTISASPFRSSRRPTNSRLRWTGINDPFGNAAGVGISSKGNLANRSAAASSALFDDGRSEASPEVELRALD